MAGFSDDMDVKVYTQNPHDDLYNYTFADQDLRSVEEYRSLLPKDPQHHIRIRLEN